MFRRMMSSTTFASARRVLGPVMTVEVHALNLSATSVHGMLLEELHRRKDFFIQADRPRHDKPDGIIIHLSATSAVDAASVSSQIDSLVASKNRVDVTRLTLVHDADCQQLVGQCEQANSTNMILRYKQACDLQMYLYKFHRDCQKAKELEIMMKKDRDLFSPKCHSHV